jgi:aminoglycoside phosphotransferase (APT) family kinase protein
MLSHDPESVLPEMLVQAIGSIFPKRRIHSFRTLKGGKTNTNVLFKVEGYDDSFVLRRHLRGSESCRKEATILRWLRNAVPVPELIDADITGRRFGTTYLLYRYIPGETFREVRGAGDTQDIEDAAYTIGSCLSRLGSLDLSGLAGDGPLPHFRLGLDDLDSAVLHERLGVSDMRLLEQMHSEWLHVLREIANAESLTHGDFNHRNVILKKTAGNWEVAGILDWERAGIGCSLSDAARFMCYERPDSKYWERAFVAGLSTGIADLPANWSDLSCVLNTMSAARSLSVRSTKEQFVPELKMIVHYGVRGGRFG